jgi:hypothetical protein
MHRHDDVAHVGAGVVHPNGHALGQFGTELPEHGSRLVHDSRAVMGTFIPGRRHTEQRARVARARHALDDIVYIRGIPDSVQSLCLHADAELGDCGPAIGEFVPGDEALLDEAGAQCGGRAREAGKLGVALAQIFCRAARLVGAHDALSAQ